MQVACNGAMNALKAPCLSLVFLLELNGIDALICDQG